MTIAAPVLNQTARVLLIAGDSWQSQCVEMLLADSEFEIRRVEQAANVAEHAAARRYDAALLELGCGAPPTELLGAIRQAAPQLPLVVLALAEQEEEAARAVAQGADAYLLEDQLGAGGLVRTLRHVMERRRLLAQREAAERAFEKRLHQEQHERRRLASSWSALQEWIAGLAHELRTPLTIVQEYCSIVRDGLAGAVTGEQTRYLGIAAEQVSNLDATLSNFVESVQLISGERIPRRKSTRLVDSTERLKPAWEAKAALRQVRLNVQVSCELPRVYCDPAIIDRVLTNLVTRAIHRSPEGGVVSLRARHEVEQGQVRLAITDTGRPLNPEAPAELRGPATSSAAEVQRTTDNLGPPQGVTLGLAATRALVHLSLGEFSVDNDPAGGTCSTFTLPEIDPEAVAASYLRFMKHHATEARTVAHILVSLDVDAGEEAAERLDELLAQRIDRDDLALRVERFVWVLIVDATGEDTPSLIERVQDAWRQAHRAQCAPEILVEARAMYHINPPSAEQSDSAAADVEPTAPRERPRVLLIDDEISIVQALQLRLSAAGYEIFAAHDGAQGLAEMKRQRPDLVLLDIRMPVMNGLTMLKRVREDEALRRIPVIVLSASHDDRKQALELGARFFLEKPYDPNILKMTVAGALEAAQSRAAKPN